MNARADLTADGGALAVGTEFFRSAEFLEAEGVTHTLRIEAGDLELRAPLIVRDIPGADLRDAVSPYGYPGIEIRAGDDASDIDPPIGGERSGASLDPAQIDWSGTGLVSIFVRHALGEPPLAGAQARSVVQIADPALPAKTRGSDRNRINKNRRLGYEMQVVAGPDADAVHRTVFLYAYEQTMRRTGAAERYFFDSAYFERILRSDRSWLALARAPGGEIAAGSLAVVSDGYLHYYLSGSADEHLPNSPMKNVVAALVELAAELDLPLNLGGGIARGDALEEFKRGFANREQPWHTSEIICDQDAYARLSSNKPDGDFFPRYRSS